MRCRMEAFYSVAGFLEKYGWYCLLTAGLLFVLYQKYLYTKVQEIQAERELAQRKKDDDAFNAKHREKLEQVRAKQQQEYAKEVERELERQRVLAEQRKNLKLGITSEEIQEKQKSNQRFDALEFVRAEILKTPLVIFSKSWCPYSRKAKQYLLGIYKVESTFYKVIELDEHDQGDLIQDALQRVTGGRSVPRVFIQGDFIGGGDDVERLSKENKLIPLLKQANIHFVE